MSSFSNVKRMQCVLTILHIDIYMVLHSFKCAILGIQIDEGPVILIDD